MLAALLFLAGLASPSEGADFAQLEPLRWSSRVLLVFAPGVNDARYQEQHKLIESAGPGGFAERDLLVLSSFSASGTLESYANEGSQEALSSAQVSALRKRFGVAENAFGVILIGKDGGEKARSDAPVQPRDIFTQIDAMPMRQREMQD